MDIAGRDGIVLGHRFMPETGQSYLGYYGNHDASQPNLAVVITPVPSAEITLAYSARQEDVSMEDTENLGNVSVASFAASAELKPITLGISVESKSFSTNVLNVPEDSVEAENTAKEAEFYLGFALSLTFYRDSIIPFLNFGNSTENDLTQLQAVSSSELIGGFDIFLTRRLGTTIAFERLGIGDNTVVQNAYLGVSYFIDSSSISFGYWTSDQKATDGRGNLASQIDLEIGYRF